MKNLFVFLFVVFSVQLSWSQNTKESEVEKERNQQEIKESFERLTSSVLDLISLEFQAMKEQTEEKLNELQTTKQEHTKALDKRVVFLQKQFELLQYIFDETSKINDKEISEEQKLNELEAIKESFKSYILSTESI